MLLPVPAGETPGPYSETNAEAQAFALVNVSAMGYDM